MKRVCAWCGKALGKKPGPDDLITHGICNRCLAEVSTDPDRTMQSFLNGIPAPILMVNAEGTVVSANRMACQRLGKRLSQVRQHLGGEVMECAWSRLPGGCGRTEHCDGCVIRTSVMKTLKTGASILRKKAFMIVSTPEGKRRRWVWISTQKMNDVVILRLDDMSEPEVYDETEVTPIRRPATAIAARRATRSAADKRK